MSRIPSGSIRFARRAALASVALAALLTLAFVAESANARGFGGGGIRSFGGARSFTTVRSVNTRTMRASTLRMNRVGTRNYTRISRTGGEGRNPGRVSRYPGIDRYPGKISRNPGNGDRNPGKVGSND